MNPKLKELLKEMVALIALTIGAVIIMFAVFEAMIRQQEIEDARVPPAIRMEVVERWGK